MKNLMLKISNMRSAQEFVIYPLKSGEKEVIVQSSTRIAQFDLTTGKGVVSKSRSGGAYFMHLQAFMGATPYTLSAQDLQTIKETIHANGTTLQMGGGVSADNSGAANVLNL